MLGRIGLLEAQGGDRMQIENTLERLRKLGVDVDLRADMDFDPTPYDIIHIFQLDWKPETYFYAKKAKKYNKPLVLSPIHHTVAELKRFDDEYVFDFRRFSKYMFWDQFHRDTFKNFYSSLFDLTKLKPTLFSIFYGFKRMQKEVLELADIVLVQTKVEVEDLEKVFGVKFEWEKVPNGVSENFSRGNQKFENLVGIKDYIVSVGRVEPRKNQLNIIKAVSKLRKELNKDLKLVFVGRASKSKHFEYNFWFNLALKQNPWIKHISAIDYRMMPSIYYYAKVGVSASWFETTGLTSLEALVCGANAVATGEQAKEYLGSYASYCDPGDVESIKEAIKKEYLSPRPEVDASFLSEYTWENAAKKSYEVYKKLLAKGSK